jgi:hypothetical protein
LAEGIVNPEALSEGEELATSGSPGDKRDFDKLSPERKCRNSQLYLSSRVSLGATTYFVDQHGSTAHGEPVQGQNFFRDHA